MPSKPSARLYPGSAIAYLSSISGIDLAPDRAHDYSGRHLDIYRYGLSTIAPWDSVEQAVRLRAEKTIRRLSEVEDGRSEGIVSLADVAVERNPVACLDTSLFVPFISESENGQWLS